jgi:ubiquinone/menaquinone biosynthesis C-methylase UbiE
MPRHFDPNARASRRLKYFNWLYNPFQRLQVTDIYDLLGTDVATEQALYLNLGYWNGRELLDNQSLDDACQSLAALVADSAAMGPGDRVLDVGFGFADQDLFWLSAYRPDAIIGLNVTASQVEVARRRVQAAGLAERIDLRLGSATAMPLEAASVDTVVALECAFHFDTREGFFQEARRVLRPGGRLVMADIIPLPAESGWWARLVQRWSWRQVARQFAIPASNAYSLAEYAAKLSASGFEAVRVESIRARIYAPLHQYLRRHPEAVARLHPATRPLIALALKLDARTVYRGLDYVLAVADQPVDEPPPMQNAV